MASLPSGHWMSQQHCLPTVTPPLVWHCFPTPAYFVKSWLDLSSELWIPQQQKPLMSQISLLGASAPMCTQNESRPRWSQWTGRTRFGGNAQMSLSVVQALVSKSELIIRIDVANATRLRVCSGCHLWMLASTSTFCWLWSKHITPVLGSHLNFLYLGDWKLGQEFHPKISLMCFGENS